MKGGGHSARTSPGSGFGKDLESLPVSVGIRSDTQGGFDRLPLLRVGCHEHMEYFAHLATLVRIQDGLGNFIPQFAGQQPLQRDVQDRCKLGGIQCFRNSIARALDLYQVIVQPGLLDNVFEGDLLGAHHVDAFPKVISFINFRHIVMIHHYAVIVHEELYIL